MEERVTYLGQVLCKLGFPFAGLRLSALVSQTIADGALIGISFLKLLFELVAVVLKLLQPLF